MPNARLAIDENGRRIYPDNLLLQSQIDDER